MKDTIEVPVELIDSLHSWRNLPVPRKSIGQAEAIIGMLPRPEHALAECPFCGAVCEHIRVPGFVPFVRCTVPANAGEGCGYEGPTNDPTGERHNRVARAARTLKNVEGYCSGVTNYTSAVSVAMFVLGIIQKETK